MAERIVAVNAGPRKGWNTETLISGTPCLTEHFIPVLLIMTSNAPEGSYAGLVEGYRQTLERFVGPTSTLVSGNTLQLKDYGATDWEWSMFDAEAKRTRHETVFPQECEKAFGMGAALLRNH